MSEGALIVIPARFGSERFPGKPMVQICGCSMLERVWRIARAVRNAQQVVIATESEEIKRFAEGWGAQVVMTSESCVSGTERVAEALSLIASDCHIVFSLQGDAVLTPPWVLEEVIAAMVAEPGIAIATPAVLLGGEARAKFLLAKSQGSSSGTAVVFDLQSNALYFSKAAIPFSRTSSAAPIYRHIGLYGYRRQALAKYCALAPSPLERAESLEQLRALEHGMKIRVVVVDYRGRTHAAVDLPTDVEYVEEIIRREGELVAVS